MGGVFGAYLASVTRKKGEGHRVGVAVDHSGGKKERNVNSRLDLAVARDLLSFAGKSKSGEEEDVLWRASPAIRIEKRDYQR